EAENFRRWCHALLARWRMDGSAGLTLAARFIAGRAEAEAELNKSGLGPLVSQVLVAAERGLISDVSAAVFRLARSCLLLPLAPHMAEVAAAACACIAGLAEEAEASSHILRVLEELARDIAIFQAFAYSFLWRTGFGTGEGRDALTTQMQVSLASAFVWLLISFGRSVGYRRLDAATLWAWTNGDALYACLLARSVLMLRELASSAAHELLVPPDLGLLEQAVVRAVLGLAGPDVAFAGVQAEVRSPRGCLVRHWARLAIAVCETGLTPALLDAPGARLASFCARLLNEDACAAEEASRMAAAMFRDVLAQCSDKFWRLLRAVPLEARQRSFLRDCAALALALPGSTECAALLEETVQAAGSAALPGLCCVASNAQLGPTEVPQLSHVLMGLTAQEKRVVASQLEKWTLRRDSAAWGSLLRDEPVETSPVAPSPPPTPLDPSQRKELAVGGLEALLVDAPPELCCSLDHRLVADPVRSPYGHVFDSASLACWLARNERCPHTGHPLALEMCTREDQLRRLSLDYVKRWARGLPP
ncbi:unnamed protein product, partial [Effrenium voratum]